MNGIEKITARIEAEARAEADAVRKQAEEQCAAIRSDYDKAAQNQYWQDIQEGAKACETRVERAHRTASMEAKKDLLALKQALVSQAFDRAQDKIVNMPAEQYAAFLTRLVVASASSGNEAVVFNQRDRDACGEAVVAEANRQLREKGLSGALTVAGETRPFAGGIILSNGRIEVNSTIETMMEMYRSSLAAQVADILFA